MFCPFFTEAFTQLFGNLDNFSFVFAFDCPLDCARDKFAVQFIHLYSFKRLVEIFKLTAFGGTFLATLLIFAIIINSYTIKLQIVEISGTFARFFQETLYGACVDLTDVCCRFNRAAVAETFDNTYNIGLRQLGVLHK